MNKLTLKFLIWVNKKILKPELQEGRFMCLEVAAHRSQISVVGCGHFSLVVLEALGKVKDHKG